MAAAGRTEYLAECFWPGVTDQDLGALDARSATAAEALAGAGQEVRYLGSWLLRPDEVVLCRFEGSPEAVRRAAEEAGVPFERILETTCSPWASKPSVAPGPRS